MIMDETNFVTTKYHVPEYKVDPNEVWFHFLHGNVPGHQIDFIYRPEVPQPPLTRQHFSHLARVVKYIEPRHSTAYSFAITNLSRDDNQHEPGHGGIALVFGLRIDGVRDHAGRQDPPFCHAAALIDRQLDASTLQHIAVQFHKKLLPVEESEVEGSGWYRSQYVPHAENPAHLEIVLKTYLADFDDLYAPGPSRQTLRWSVDGVTVPRRVTIIYPDRVDFPTLAECMARIAEVLIESNIKWTAISNGREQDVSGGLTVRFVPRREATDASADEALLYLEHVPTNPADIAAQLFNAHELNGGPRLSRLPPPPAPVARSVVPQDAAKNNGVAHHGSGYRSGGETSRPWAKPELTAEVVQESVDSSAQGLGIVAVVEKKETGESLGAATEWASEYKKNERKQRKQTTNALAATVIFIVVFGGLALIWLISAPKPVDEPSPAASQTPRMDTPGNQVPTTNTPVPSALAKAAPEPSNVVQSPRGSEVLVFPSATISPVAPRKKKAVKGGGAEVPDF